MLISTLHIRRLQKQSGCFPHANPYISNVTQRRWSHFRAWVACDKICALGRDLELSNLETRQEGSMADWKPMLYVFPFIRRKTKHNVAD